MADVEENLRADARANRDRILKVARKALVTDPAASLNSIAKESGVGAGTLYRHFPSRESLVLGVYRKEIDTLAGLAPLLLTQHCPQQAFRLWCDQFTESGKMMYGVADIVHAAMSEQDVQETYWSLVSAVRQLTAACEGSGDINLGANPEDVLVLLGLLSCIPPDAAGEARVRRLLALLFRGLGAKDTTGLEAVPL